MWKINKDIFKFISLASLLVIFVLVFYFAYPRSFELMGNVQSVVDNSVFLSARFVKSRDKSLTEFQNVQVIVTPETKITKIGLVIPTGVAYYWVDDLKKEESVVSLDVMFLDINEYSASMIVKSNKNIYGKSVITAKEIIYRTPIYR